MTALGLGGVFAISNSKSFADTNDLDSTTEYSQDSMGANPPQYLYKDGKLEAYNENEASHDGAITIATDQFKEGDSINIIVDDSM